MSKIFITSDTHLNHDREFIWGARGFTNIREMNKAIIDNWNRIVAPEDIVYHLGDTWLGDLEEGAALFSQLNGNIYVAIGNHDTDARIDALCGMYKIVDVQMEYRLVYRKHCFILNHYPTIVTNVDTPPQTKVICLCGHTHTTNPFKDWEYGCYHVEVDAHDCCPIALDDIITNLDKHKNL